MKTETLLMAYRDDELDRTPVDSKHQSLGRPVSETSSGQSDVEEGDASSCTPSPVLIDKTDPFEFSDDLYGPTLRSVPLLSREEEETLGRTIREGRVQMTASLARIPAAVGVLVDFVIRADARERPITDALFAPFDSFTELAEEEADTEGMHWREVARMAHGLFDEWQALFAGPSSREAIDTMRARLETFVCSIQPGMVALREALHVCQELERRVAAVESEQGAFHADMLDADPPTRGHETLLAIRDRAGVDLTTLRACCRRAESAYTRYSSARDRMINANLRLAYFMAHRLKGNGISFDDLVQEAMFGLMRAVDKFDYRKGYKFSTYAVQWIRQTTTRAIAESSRTIRVAAHAHDEMVRVRKLARELEQQLGREPNVRELAKISGLAESKIEQYSRLARQTMSLDYPPPDVQDSPLSAIVPDPMIEDPDVSTHDARLAESVAAILDTLPPREAFIMRLRHGIGGTEAHTLEEIGQMLGITRERTRQLEARAMEQLRETVRPELLEGLDD